MPGSVQFTTYLFLFFQNGFIFDDIYRVEKDACLCRALIKVGRIKEWGKVDATTLPIFLSILAVSGGVWERQGEERVALNILTASVPEDGGQSPMSP